MGLAPVIEMLKISNGALPLLLSVAVCCAEVVPTVVAKLIEAGESEAAGRGAGVAVPVRLVLCTETAALSVTASAPGKLPAVTGAKVTEIEQLAPAASDAPQLLVWLNNPVGSLVTAMLVMVSGEPPVLLSVAVCAAEVVPATAVKLSEDGVSEATGGGGTGAVPWRLTTCTKPPGFSLTTRAPGTSLGVSGEKVIENEQLAPTASDAPQLLVWLNNPFGSLDMEMLAMVRGALPVLLSVAVCAAEVVPADVLKLNDSGKSVAAGDVPVPVRAIDWAGNAQDEQLGSTTEKVRWELYAWATAGEKVTTKLQLAPGAIGLAQFCTS